MLTAALSVFEMGPAGRGALGSVFELAAARDIRVFAIHAPTRDMIQFRVGQNAWLGFLFHLCFLSLLWCGRGVAAPRCALERTKAHLAAVMFPFLHSPLLTNGPKASS